ncbi:unnamed protein product [Ranitomeya imitator]|uniref:Uncharacterized protein n=1 Tax=Ranitomeya imitator TaxID=111125 RepID=A0ABN9KYX0_9NEOB|nr:unnamed protein product [Ranitomeya imitator]
MDVQKNKQIKPDMSLKAMITKLMTSLLWTHHTKREQSLKKDIMVGRIEGTRRRGRPATRWLHTIKITVEKTLDDAVLNNLRCAVLAGYCSCGWCRRTTSPRNQDYKCKWESRTILGRIMPSCLVNQCNSKTGRKGQSEQIILHPFPKDISRITVWLQQTGQIFKDLNTMAQKILEGNKQNKHRLCSRHFTPDSYIINVNHHGKSLSFDAVPSIFSNVKEGENIIEENLKKKRVRRKKKQIDAENQSLHHSLIEPSTTIIINRIKMEEDLLQVYPTCFTNERLYAAEETLKDVELRKIGFSNIETQTAHTLSNSTLVFKDKQAVGSDDLDRPPSSDAAAALSMGLMSKLKLHMDSMLREVEVRFDDVAVYFSAEEWESLGMVDKLMYMDVMLENYYTLFSLGFIFEKPEIISIIEEFQDHYHTADVQSVSVKEEPEYHSETEASTGYWTSESSVGSKSGRLSHTLEATTGQDLVDRSLYNDVRPCAVKEEPEYFSETDVSTRYWTAESFMGREQKLLVQSQNCNGVEQPVYPAEDFTRQDLVDQSIYNAVCPPALRSASLLSSCTVWEPESRAVTSPLCFPAHRQYRRRAERSAGGQTAVAW